MTFKPQIMALAKSSNTVSRPNVQKNCKKYTELRLDTTILG